MPGPDDFNGYGYFYVRLYWTGFGFQATFGLCTLSLGPRCALYIGMYGSRAPVGVDTNMSVNVNARINLSIDMFSLTIDIKVKKRPNTSK